MLNPQFPFEIPELRVVDKQVLADSLQPLIPALVLLPSPRERILVFEKFIVESFSKVILQKYLPAVGCYTQLVLSNSPATQEMLVNQLGELGIKALAGVVAVMCKSFDSGVVQQAMPGIYTLFMHHLLEVVSDKLGGHHLATQLSIPLDFVDVFNTYALQIISGASFVSVQSAFLQYLSESSLQELDITQFHPDMLGLLNDSAIAYAGSVGIDTHELKKFFEHPVKYMLLLNLLVVEIARDQVKEGWVFSDSAQALIPTGKTILHDFTMHALMKRYESSLLIHRKGYQAYGLDKALALRADSILTDYTMSKMISSLASVDADLHAYVSANHETVEKSIRIATTLIGLANDCGSRILRMSSDALGAMLNELSTDAQAQSLSPREYLALAAKSWPKDSFEYRALFPLLKDATKQEANLAFDLRLMGQEELWSQFHYTVFHLSARFQALEDQLYEMFTRFPSDAVTSIITNFVHYNYQIYDAGVDYDNQTPLIDQLQVLD